MSKELSDLKHERETIREALASHSKYLFMLEKRWWDQWQRYTDFNSDIATADISQEHYEETLRFLRPSYITNFTLVEMNSEYNEEYQYCIQQGTFAMAHERFSDWNKMKLKSALTRDEDYVLVSNRVWKKLVTSYGGAPEIVIFKNPKLDSPDTFPQVVNVGRFDDAQEFSDVKGFLASPRMDLKSYVLYVCHMLLIPPHKASLVILSSKNEPIEGYCDGDKKTLCFKNVGPDHEKITIAESMGSEGHKLIVRQNDSNETSYRVSTQSQVMSNSNRDSFHRRSNKVAFADQSYENTYDRSGRYDVLAHNSNLSEEEAMQQAIRASLGIEEPNGGAGHEGDDMGYGMDYNIEHGSGFGMGGYSIAREESHDHAQDQNTSKAHATTSSSSSSRPMEVRQEVDPKKVMELQAKAIAAMKDPIKYQFAKKQLKEIRNNLNVIHKELLSHNNSSSTGRKSSTAMDQS
mmetsp:Transcript_61799/g.70898  ORF Transcript_61799/g.70898 Transcript_61799/m.70898 type:complete len:462 (+) Transcript_61799:110-1495(+)